MQGPFWSGTFQARDGKVDIACLAEHNLCPCPFWNFSSDQCCPKYISLCLIVALICCRCRHVFLFRIFHFGQLSECHHCQLIRVVISHSVWLLCYCCCSYYHLFLSLTLFLFDCCIIDIIVIFFVVGISSLSVWLLHCFCFLALSPSSLSSSHYLG